ncbi:MAG: FtsX-like permease family protein [Thermodesulfobacteriota bacterium]
MNYPLLKVTLGYVRRHLLQNFLLVIGIAFGVALIVSVDIANQSATRSFKISKEILSTKTTHFIQGKYSDFDETLYKDLRVELLLSNLAPIVEDYVNIPSLDGRSVKLLGTDLFADLIFYDNQSAPLSNITGDTLTKILTVPNSALISEDLANSAFIEVGDFLKVDYGSKKLQLQIVGFLNNQDSELSKSLGGLILTDVSTAQELLDKVGLLSQIDLLIDDETESTSDIISQFLPSETQLKEKDELLGSAKNLTRSFELNLTALSLLALFVGVFLIYNIVSFSVIQRRSIIGTLRSIGATRRQIFKMILSEALIIGFIGSIIGIFGGIFLGRTLVALVTRSINDLYFTLTVTDFSISTQSILKGFLAGVVAVIIAAIVPSLEASRFRPINVLRRSSFESFFMKSVTLFGIIGLLFITLGYLLIIAPTKSLILSLLSIFLVLFGVSFLVPLCTKFLMKLFSKLMTPFGRISQMAPRNIVRATSRTAVAIASLTVAISVILSVSIMIGSFRSTVVSWLDAALTADIFITIDSPNISSQKGLDPGILEQISTTPGVERVASVRRLLYDSPDYGTVNIVSVTKDLAADNREFIWQESSNSDELWDHMISGSVLISESFAYKNNIKPNQNETLTFQTDRGQREFKVSGIYYDYGAQGGIVLIAEDMYRTLWDDDQITSLGVYLNEDQNAIAVEESLRSKLSSFSNIVIRSNSNLKKSAIKTFDRTFTVTSALRLLIAIVAFISVLSSLMALQLEREREFGVLRAIGMSVGQLRKMLFLENGLIGLTSGVLAIPVGLTLAIILIYVVNLRSFGWTLNFSLELSYFLEALGIALLAALAAGIYPAYLIGKENVSKLIREE